VADQVVDSLLIELRLRTAAMEQGLASAQHKLEEFAQKQAEASEQAAKRAGAASEAAAKQTEEAAKRAAEKVEAEANRAAAALAASASVALAGIVSAIKEAVAAASEYQNAMMGLSSIAAGAGQDFGALQSAVEELTKDGLMPASDAATALKNLLVRGFSAGEAVEMLRRLKDAAAFGRQGSLSLGEAVRSAAEGIKNENSVNYCPAWGRPLAA